MNLINKHQASAICMLWSLAHPGFAASSVDIFYFGNNQYPASNIEAASQMGARITLYNLDAQVNLEKQLSEGLPADDLEKAAVLARQRVAQISPQEMAGLFTGVLQARQWGITRFPAVVFGQGDAVIYGVTDLEQAMIHWQGQSGRRTGQ